MIAYKILYLAIYFAIKDILYLAIKVNVPFYKQCSQAETRLICKRTILPQNASIFFLALIFLYISEKKKTVEKLCKVLEMELKTYTPASPKFIFEKIKFKVLHYIQHNFIRQHPGFSKKQASSSKISSHILMVI